MAKISSGSSQVDKVVMFLHAGDGFEPTYLVQIPQTQIFVDRSCFLKTICTFT